MARTVTRYGSYVRSNEVGKSSPEIASVSLQRPSVDRILPPVFPRINPRFCEVFYPHRLLPNPGSYPTLALTIEKFPKRRGPPQEGSLESNF